MLHILINNFTDAEDELMITDQSWEQLSPCERFWYQTTALYLLIPVRFMFIKASRFIRKPLKTFTSQIIF